MVDVGQKLDIPVSSDPPCVEPSVAGDPNQTFLQLLIREQKRIRRRAEKQNITAAPSVRENLSLKACRLTTYSQLDPSLPGINSLRDYFAKPQISNPSA